MDANSKSFEQTAHEIDDDTHWLLRPFLRAGRGIRKIVEAAGRLTSPFAAAKDYPALIAQADQRAAAAAQAGARGVAIAQFLFSGSVADLFDRLREDGLSHANAEKYEKLRSGITLLDNAAIDAGARRGAIKLRFEEIFGPREAARLLQKYTQYVSTHRFPQPPAPAAIAEALGLAPEKRPPAQRAKTDALLRNLADHAQSDLARLAGANEAARDNRDGLIMLRAVVDSLAGKDKDEDGRTFRNENLFSFQSGAIKNERNDLQVFDRQGRPILDTSDAPRLFYAIDVRQPESAGVLAGLLNAATYKRPQPGDTREGIEAGQRERQNAGAGIAPHHPAIRPAEAAPAETEG